MARQTCISAEEMQRAKQLRDQATTVAEYRTALSVILSAAIGLDADQTAEVLGTSRRTIFRDLAACLRIPRYVGEFPICGVALAAFRQCFPPDSRRGSVKTPCTLIISLIQAMFLRL